MGCKGKVCESYEINLVISEIQENLRKLVNEQCNGKKKKKKPDKHTFAVSEIMSQVEVWVDFSWVFIKKWAAHHFK